MTNKRTTDMERALESDREELEGVGTRTQGLILKDMLDTLLETQGRIRALEKEKSDA